MEIKNFQHFSNSNSVLATFDIYLPALKMTIHNVKIVKSKSGKQFYSIPSYPYTTESGEKKYQPVVSFSKEKQTDFYHALKKELQAFSVEI